MFTTQDVTTQLNWRYATKMFDQTKKLSNDQLQAIKESMRFSPSSLGLQPWKFYQIENPAVRQKIAEAAWGQPQITQASHLFVFASKKEVSVTDAEQYLDLVSASSGMTKEQLAPLQNMLQGFMTGHDESFLHEWAARQVAIPLGMAVATAAYLGIDACPMEGFDREKVDEVLGLKDSEFTSRTLLALGFRDEKDPVIQRKKVRYPENEVFEVVA